MAKRNTKCYYTYRLFSEGRQANVVLALISLILFPFKYLFIIRLPTNDINIDHISDVRISIIRKSNWISIIITYGPRLY